MGCLLNCLIATFAYEQHASHSDRGAASWSTLSPPPSYLPRAAFGADCTECGRPAPSPTLYSPPSLQPLGLRGLLLQWIRLTHCWQGFLRPFAMRHRLSNVGLSRIRQAVRGARFRQLVLRSLRRGRIAAMRRSRLAEGGSGSSRSQWRGRARADGVVRLEDLGPRRSAIVRWPTGSNWPRRQRPR